MTMGIDRGTVQPGAPIQTTNPTLVGRSSDGCLGTLACADEISAGTGCCWLIRVGFLWLVAVLRLAVGWCCGGRGRVGASVMSMRLMLWPEVPEQTVRVVRAAFLRGSLAIRLWGEIGPVFQDADFVGAFGARGRPGIAPSLLMLVTVLQFVERLTDRQAAVVVAGRIDWKYAPSLE
ncbi:MAG TPA: transposase [Actinocrinis sp.]|uniref:transposase n=1 Tax=Actinocrinis sp. TaxID=1920516 RepID=UPI002DDCC889|nr:transposase [Actinocrinis sp.]HEV2345205.1 transposase [Actinocrinis sp.]